MVLEMTNIHTLTIQHPENPCINCGACCAYFRVSFYWAESTEGGRQRPYGISRKSHTIYQLYERH